MSELESPFLLRAGPFTRGDELIVRRWDGVEAISSCYRFRIECTCRFGPPIVQAILLGASATLTALVPHRKPRHFGGIVTRIESVGLHETDDCHAYRLTIRPRLWLLRKQTNSRIFRQLTAREIVESIFQEAHIASRMMLVRAQKARPYTVQYQESDFAFVTRLLAEEGVAYFFEHPGSPPTAILPDGLSNLLEAAASTGAALLAGGQGGETVVLTDGDDFDTIDAVCTRSLSEQSLPPGAQSLIPTLSGTGTFTGNLSGITPEVPMRDRAGMTADDEAIMELSVRRELAPMSVELRDYDPSRPTIPMEANASIAASSPQLHSSLSSDGSIEFGLSTDLPPRSLPASMFTHYLHDRQPQKDATRDSAQRVLMGLRHQSSRAKGRSTCRRLSPGHRFAVTDHAIGEFNTVYVVTRIRHVGTSPTVLTAMSEAPAPVYENDFACVPKKPIPPPPPDRRVVQNLEPATVAGPPGQELHCDPMGGVNLRFFWDRSETDTDSFFVPVCTPIGGPMQGIQFVPRVGTTALVKYLSGDVDRPIVVGTMHTRVAPPPFSAEELGHTWGIRSRSLGGNGYNELSLRDGQSPRLHLRAERELAIDALGSRARKVGSAEEAGDESTAYVVTVHGCDQQETQGTQASTTYGNDTTHVYGEAHSSAAGRVAEDTQGEATLHIAGTLDDTYSSHHGLGIGQCRTVVVSGALDTMTTGSHATSLRRTGSLAAIGAHSVSSKSEALTATKKLTLSAGKELRVRCGRTELVLLPDRIELHGAAIRTEATETVTARAGETRMTWLESAAKWETTGDGILVGDQKVVLCASDAKLEVHAASGGGVVAVGGHLLAQGKSSKLDLDDSAVLEGPTVGMKTATPKTESLASESPDDVRSWLDIILTDQLGIPVPGAPYLLSAEGGGALYGTLDESGRGHVELPKGGATVTFTDFDSNGLAAKKTEPTTTPQSTEPTAPLAASGPVIAHVSTGLPTVPVGLDALIAAFGAKDEATLASLQVSVPMRCGKGGKIVKGVKCHKLMADTFIAIFEEIYQAGLSKYILEPTYAAYCFRRNRNNPSVLSVHSWGVAIDVNPATNANGQKVPSADQELLAPYFEKRGFYWGKHFKDPMHFQYCRKY